MGKQVGTFIKVSREKIGLSQGEMARLLKLKTAQSISNIERGISPLPRQKIKTIAKVLEVSKEDLVGLLIAEAKAGYLKAAGLKKI